MSNFRAIRESFERLTSAHRTRTAATRAPVPPAAPSPPPAEVGPWVPTDAEAEVMRQYWANEVTWVGPPPEWDLDDDDDPAVRCVQVFPVLAAQEQDDDLRRYSFEKSEWTAPPPPTASLPTRMAYYDEELLQTFLRAGYTFNAALRLAMTNEPRPAEEQEQEIPSTPSPLTTVPELPPSPATSLASAAPPTTPLLDVLALEELVGTVQAQVETLVQVRAKCDRGFRGLGLERVEMGPGMGQRLAKELHGRLQLEELPHLVEVEELEEHEQGGPAMEHCGIARCYARYKVWDPGVSQI